MPTKAQRSPRGPQLAQHIQEQEATQCELTTPGHGHNTRTNNTTPRIADPSHDAARDPQATPTSPVCRRTSTDAGAVTKQDHAVPLNTQPVTTTVFACVSVVILNVAMNADLYV
ncbi:hypothetical protein XENOCAPTIV_029240 [Xenoophorus captivus]|uniref:Uncharacterized protein n=1 Tax=Xenoophorus captivus TaxID=1517983 RepID=A0ABV0RE46_9TELE